MLFSTPEYFPLNEIFGFAPGFALRPKINDLFSILKEVTVAPSASARTKSFRILLSKLLVLFVFENKF